MFAATLPEMVQALSFEQAVPRRFVHRQAVSEVYLTDSAPDGAGDRFLVAAQWPRQHTFYRSCAGRYDTMLLAETLRQCAIYLAHRHYAVPLGRKFTMQRMHVEVDLDRMLPGPGAAEVTLDARFQVRERRHGRVSVFAVTVDFHIDGVVVGNAETVAGILTLDEYEHARWRGDRAPVVGQVPLLPPISPTAVCVQDSRAVVLAPHPSGSGHGRWLLRTDLTHPVLFDHPCDHVPGAVLLEAARQSARLHRGSPCADVESVDLVFQRFVELDEPTTVAARLAAGHLDTVEVEFTQWGVTKALGVVRLEPPAGEGRHAEIGSHRA